MTDLNKTLDYTDIVLQPSNKMGIIGSRTTLSTEVEFLGRKFANPVVPANMKCTIDATLADTLHLNRYFYILHRFYNYSYLYSIIEKGQKSKLLSISVGVQAPDYELIEQCSINNLHIDYITIDVSHGHHILVKEMAEYIKDMLPNTKIIAGNVTTKRACLDYKDWGIDAAKVGLARGKACSTFNKTGIGSFMFSAVKECASSGLPIIADGGIREIKDISIALVAGANMVMVGSLFAACEDSPAPVLQPYPDIEHIKYKIYYGSASAKNKGHNKYIEGEDEIRLNLVNKTYLDFHDEIEQGMQSTMSFGNIKTVADFKKIKYLHK